MRVPWWLFLLFVPLVSAQIADDPAGDYEYQVGDVSVPGSNYPYLDLVSVAVDETPEEFYFALGFDEIDEIPGEHQQVWYAREAFLHFEYAGREHVIRYDRVMGALSPSPAYDCFLTEADTGAPLAELDCLADADADTVTAVMPRDALSGVDGEPALKAGILSGFWAESLARSGAEAGTSERWYDRMPDEGASPQGYEIAYGLRQSGTARLSSDHPFRISNGEATTMVFEVVAANIGDDAQTFQFTAQDVPEGWQPLFPHERLEIAADSSEILPVLVTVPFNHQHGTTQSMRVEMTSDDDSTLGQVELGIRYTDTPQPSGHHPTVFFHSHDRPAPGVGGNELALPLFLSDQGYFNTLEDDPLSDGQVIRNRGRQCPNVEEVLYQYVLYLSPRLAMGLDFDPARTGLLEMSFTTPTPILDGEVDGALYVDGADTVRVANTTRQQFSTSSPGETVPLTLEIVPTPEGDYVPYTEDAQLRLNLTVRDRAVHAPALCFNLATEAPEFAVAGSMTLPLDEYHDDVSESFGANAGIDLATATTERLANPGRIVRFDITINSTFDGRWDLELTGQHDDWASLDQDSVSVTAGIPSRAAVTVRVPADAASGDVADLRLLASHPDIPAATDVLRMTVIVDDRTEHPSDVPAGGAPAQRAPGIGWISVAVPAVLSRMRRHGRAPEPVA